MTSIDIGHSQTLQFNLGLATCDLTEVAWPFLWPNKTAHAEGCATVSYCYNKNNDNKY